MHGRVTVTRLSYRTNIDQCCCVCLSRGLDCVHDIARTADVDLHCEIRVPVCEWRNQAAYVQHLIRTLHALDNVIIPGQITPDPFQSGRFGMTPDHGVIFLFGTNEGPDNESIGSGKQLSKRGRPHIAGRTR